MLIFFIIIKKSPLLLRGFAFFIGTMCLILKIAAAPFHFWFIKVAKKLPWTNNIILFTWQKLVPLYLLVFQMKRFLFPYIARSAFIGAILLVNKKSLKEIFGFSSVFNLSWLIRASMVRAKAIFFFLVVYWPSLIHLLWNVTGMKKLSINDTKHESYSKPNLFLRIVNIAGVPPFVIFTAKWYVFSRLLKIRIAFLATRILILRRINIFIYFRVINFSNILNSVVNQKEIKKYKKEKILIILNLCFLIIFLI